MKVNTTRTALLLILSLTVIVQTTLALNDDFNSAVKLIERFYGVKHMEIPFLAKAGIFSGTVSLNSVPLPNAKVILTGGALRINVSTLSSSTGSFSFGSVPYGTYTVTVSIPGTTTNAYYSMSMSGTAKVLNLDLQY